MAKFTRSVPATACGPVVESDGWITVQPDPVTSKGPKRRARTEGRPPADPPTEDSAK